MFGASYSLGQTYKNTPKTTLFSEEICIEWGQWTPLATLSVCPWVKIDQEVNGGTTNASQMGVAS